MTRRVVVTGLGCVSALGQGVQTGWANLIAGESGVRRLSRTMPDASHLVMDGPAGYLERVDGTAVEAFAGRRLLSQVDRVAAQALVATHEALGDAGLLDEPAMRAGAFIVYGGASGGNGTVEDGFKRVFLLKQATVHPLSIPRAMSSASVSQISMAFGIKGTAFAVSSACSSSAHAISEAMHMIRAGRTKIVVTGGTDASITIGAWISWKALQAMSPTACRPFSAGRDGMVLGEGAATLVLEDYEHAVARGATIYAEVIGAGGSSDAFHLTQPDGIGAVSAMRAAYADAGFGPDVPALISAHGTATPLNDKTEAGAIREVAGEFLDRHAVIATKSAHGHLLGAGGALEFLIGVLALRERRAPAVLNYLGLDPECDLPLVLGEARSIDAEVLVSNAFAFGGLNSVLIAKLL
jgi:nodulation protein E